MPELYYELPSAIPAGGVDALPRSIRGAPIAIISLAALVAGELAYNAVPPPEDWQKWFNKAMRHWLWHEMHRRRRKHYPSGYTDTSHAPIH